MAWNDYGYMEDDQLGRPYDFKLLRRLAAYARDHAAKLALVVVMILASTGLELVLPYLTRVAIDDHIFRQAVGLHPDRVGGELWQELRAQAGSRLWEGEGGAVFIDEKVWRGLDLRLNTRLRQIGAVDSQAWHIATPGEAARMLARSHPQLFRAAGEKLLIAASDMKKLRPEEISQLRSGDVWGLIRLALVFLAACTGVFLLGYGQYAVLERAGQEMMYKIRQDLYSSLLARPLGFFSKNPVGKLVTRLTNDVQNLIEMYRSTIVALCQDLLLLAGIVVVLLVLDWGLALWCLALAPFISALAWLFARMAREAFRQLQGHLGRINARLQETLIGLAMIKLLTAEETGRREFKRLNDAYYGAGMQQVKVFTFFMPLTDFFASLAVALILWYGGGQVVQERLSLGTLVAFLFYMQMFFRPVRDMAEKYNILQAAMASAERIFHLMDQDPSPAQPPIRHSASEPGPGQVVFDSVSFAYEPGRMILTDLSFTIPPGERWAVVGPTGAGKTTCVNLLARLYYPSQGRVLIDGVDLRKMSEDELTARVALVPQEVFLFTGSVEENITLGRPGVDEKMLDRSLRVSGAQAVAESLPQGRATALGEGARKLSAGQRQLLALARALAGEPRVLLLDEATSSVDPESERLIQEALPRVMAGRTSLVVAHRLSTIREADNILVMCRGRIIEQGRHEKLLRTEGLYSRLVRIEEMKSREQNGNGYRD